MSIVVDGKVKKELDSLLLSSINSLPLDIATELQLSLKNDLNAISEKICECIDNKPVCTINQKNVDKSVHIDLNCTKSNHNITCDSIEDLIEALTEIGNIKEQEEKCLQIKLAILHNLSMLFAFAGDLMSCNNIRKFLDKNFHWFLNWKKAAYLTKYYTVFNINHEC